MANIISRKCLNFNLIRSLNNQRSYTSALYVPGNKAHKTFAYLSPDLDFDNRFSDPQKLQTELNLRGLKVDVQELKKTWDYFQYVTLNRNTLETKQAELTNQVKVINQKEDQSPDKKKEMEAIITQIRLLKQDLKVMKNAAWELEETVIPQLLKLPNETDEQTPAENSIVLKTIGEKPNVPENNRQSHLDIGQNLGLIDYRNPIQCYLCNEAAAFELGVISSAGKIMNQHETTRIAGPDFSRSILVEGCGMDHEDYHETFILQNTDDVDKDYLINRLHIVGGASLPALLAMFTKQTLRPSSLPLRIFTSGRQYTPFPKSTVSYGLFSICQATAVQALTLVEKKDSDVYKNEFENLIDATSEIYDNIGCHYRVVLRSAKELNLWESLRVSFEMWSTYSNQYVEVGHVSACGEYFSKRLLIAYQSSNKSGFPSAITGTLVYAPRIIGCLLEENPEKFVLPEKITGVFSQGR